MRINESKSRRFFIMEQISVREHSRQKLRKSSAERRKKIEQSFGDFMKTMSDVSYRQTGGSEVFRLNRMDEEGKLYSQNSPKRKQVEAQYNEAMNSPSFQDINILDEFKEGEEIKIERQETILKEQHNEVEQRGQGGRQMKKSQQQVIGDEQIVYDNKQTKIQRSGKSIVQNNVSIASSSGIFFTSQFNDFINQNHLQPIPQSNPVGDSQKDINPIKESQHQTLKEPRQGNNFNPDQNCQENASSELDIHSNQKPQQQQQQHHLLAELQQVKQINQQTIKQPDHNKQQQNILNNKSSHSLAFSNQSSLKYSLNESNIKTIINQKFTHQLVINTNQFSNEQQPSLFFHLKLQILIDQFHTHFYKSTIKDLKTFFKIYQLSRTIIKRYKRTGFQAFLINQQLNLLDKKNQIKLEYFLNCKQQQKYQTIFYTLKQLFFILPRQKLQQATQHYNQKQLQQTQKIFRCLKIIWFDQKVKKQIDLYYLSKLFSHFSKILKTQKQQNRQKCLSLYCFNLKKRFFKLFKEGVDKSQMERIQRDNATCHYSFVLMRKVFDAWRDTLAYKDRYISLAMTTKNTFKETADQRWMQIKTVDFRQIK